MYLYKTYQYDRPINLFPISDMQISWQSVQSTCHFLLNVKLSEHRSNVSFCRISREPVSYYVVTDGMRINTVLEKDIECELLFSPYESKFLLLVFTDGD